MTINSCLLQILLKNNKKDAFCVTFYDSVSYLFNNKHNYVITEQGKKEIIQKLIAECKWYFDNANDYYSKSSEFKRREEQVVKPLGQQLFDVGGLSLMRSVYTEVEEACLSAYGRHCRSALDMRWNGVGSWQS